jgi:CRISPR-associated protein Csx17
LNEARIERMLAGLMLLDWRQVDWRRLQAPAGVEAVRTRAPEVSAAVSLLKPLFAQDPVASRRNAGQAVRADPTVPRLLASNRVDEALQAAVRTLRIEHIAPLLNDTRSAALHHDGRRLAATALVPVSPRYAEVLLGNISEPSTSTSTPSPSSESEQTQ